MDKTDSKSHIFQKPKTLVSDNAPEFCDEDPNLWLEKYGANRTRHRHVTLIEWVSGKNGADRTRHRHITLIEWVSGKNGADRKNGTKSMFSRKRKKEVFLLRLLLSYDTIPHAKRLASPSVLRGRQIRAPFTMSCSTNEKMWYKKKKESNPEKAKFMMQKGHNTAIINREKGNSILERNTGERQGEESNPGNETIAQRSTRPTRGIRPIHFREM